MGPSGAGTGALGSRADGVPTPLLLCPGRRSGPVSHLLELCWLFQVQVSAAPTPHLDSAILEASQSCSPCFKKCFCQDCREAIWGFFGIRKRHSPLGRPIRKKHPSGCNNCPRLHFLQAIEGPWHKAQRVDPELNFRHTLPPITLAQPGAPGQAQPEL